MARITDTERGARIAHDHAQSVLPAASRKDDLFPLRLTRHQRQLWQGILQAAECELEEHLFSRVELARLGEVLA
ncbi:hypothetical protein ACM9XC_07310 [Xanthomonas sacchari]